jgi:hypothetical protein
MTGDPEPSHDDMILNVQKMVVQTRMTYYNQLTHRETITKELHRELASRVLQYADVLRVFQDRIDDFPNVDRVRQKMGQMEPVEVEAPGDTRNRIVEEQPAVLSIDADDLLQMTNELDDIAQQLGFGADADVEPPAGPHGDDR